MTYCLEMEWADCDGRMRIQTNRYASKKKLLKALDRIAFREDVNVTIWIEE